MTAMSPGRSRLVRFLVRRSTRAVPEIPGDDCDDVGSVGSLRRPEPLTRRGHASHGAESWPEQFLGVRPGRRPSPRPAEHPGELAHPLVAASTIARRLGDHAVGGDLVTTRCWSANAATCARWVTTSTWRRARASRQAGGRSRGPPDRRRRRRPRRTRRCRPRRPGAVASTTSRPSITRDSSPPEAPLPSGRAGARMRDEQELDVVAAVVAPVSSAGSTLDHAALAPAMERPGSSAVTAAARRSAPPSPPCGAPPPGCPAVVEPARRPRAAPADPVVVAVELEQAAARAVRPGQHLVDRARRSCASGCPARRVDAARPGRAGSASGPRHTRPGPRRRR